jgi:hypothetical protein
MDTSSLNEQFQSSQKAFNNAIADGSDCIQRISMRLDQFSAAPVSVPGQNMLQQGDEEKLTASPATDSVAAATKDLGLHEYRYIHDAVSSIDYTAFV